MIVQMLKISVHRLDKENATVKNKNKYQLLKNQNL